jgi:hypothetical protein
MPNGAVKSSEELHPPRMKLLAYAMALHAAGLFVTGALGTLGTTAGFDLLGGGLLGVFIGGLMSSPWFVASCVPLLAAPSFAVKRPVLLSLFLALVVSATWFAFFNDGRSHTMEFAGPVSAATSAALAIGGTVIIRLRRAIANPRPTVE